MRIVIKDDVESMGAHATVYGEEKTKVWREQSVLESVSEGGQCLLACLCLCVKVCDNVRACVVCVGFV